MQKQVVTCVNLGMNRDTGISQLSEKNANYAFENYNIRITAVNDNTLYTVTNEKGTKNSGITLVGKFLGSCILNDYIVIFTLTTSTMQPYSDYIYRVKYNTNNGKLENTILYSGNLFFDLSCPIEAIGYYESEEVQKVYWVDGKNPNRFINIADTSEGSAPNYSSGDSYLFDFLGHINHIPKVDIIKNYSKAGTFQAGTILYFATYFNKYGVETCIVWLSDLLYISAIDRGAKPEELVTCSFDFTINNIDTSYDYIRIYAAYRAGLNGSAEGRLVTEIEIPKNSSSIVFSDLGNDYLNYNAEDIHYIGGQNIIASTLDYKQDTLFLGDIQLKNTSDDLSDLRDVFRTACEQNLKTYEGITINESPYIQWEYKKISDKNSTADSYVQQINKSQLDIAGFKYREIYRFGILFMDEYGEWTSAIWIGDKYCDLAPCSPFVIPVLLYVDIYDYENGQYKATGEYISVWDETDLEYKGYYILANIDNKGLKIYSYWYSPLPLSQLYERIYLNNNGYKDTGLDVSTTSYISAQDLHIDGVYIAQAKFTGVGSDLDNTLSAKYKAYRLLVAETDYLNRRIITLGVINPTMFNFKDRENNLPYSINSWIFRPRNSEITHQHYDTLPLQNSDYAEILGIMNKEVPGYKKGELLDDDDDSLNSFVLLFAPNYLAGCRLDYRLVYYNITSCLDYKQSNYSKILELGEGKTLSDDTLTGLEAALTIAHDNNYLTEEALELELFIPYNYENYKVISEGLIKETTWEKVITSLISKITEDTKAKGEKIVISQSMLPTADLMKKAASEGDGSKVGIYLGLAVATVAAVVASIFSFGAAAAATAPALVLAWSAAASAATIGAIGGASAIGAIAEDDRYNENAKDIDKQLSLKGIYNVLDGHSLSLRRGWAYFANKVLLLMFGEDSVPEFVWGNNLDLLGESSNVYMMGGRLTLVSEKEEAKEDKLASFYVDESIVTLNSPDILEVKQYIDKSSSYDLNLIGTIPIDTVQEDYIMYAENGLSNTATPLLGVASNKEALVNGFLYQDSEWPSPSSYSGGTIQATAAVQAYKVFMWNRNTSWSLWFPGIDLKDVYGNAVETAPAKPIKKIFANYKGSNSTTYLPINTIYKTTINPIIVFDSPTTSLSTITLKNTSYFYQGNLDTIVIPPDNYTLIANNNSNEFYYTSDSDKNVVAIHCKDPIPLRYNTLPHAVISIDNADSPILPLTNAFEVKAMHDLYENVTLSDYDIQGVTEAPLWGFLELNVFDSSIFNTSSGLFLGVTNPGNSAYVSSINTGTETENVTGDNEILDKLRIVYFTRSLELQEAITQEWRNYLISKGETERQITSREDVENLLVYSGPLSKLVTSFYSHLGRADIGHKLQYISPDDGSIHIYTVYDNIYSTNNLLHMVKLEYTSKYLEGSTPLGPSLNKGTVLALLESPTDEGEINTATSSVPVIGNCYVTLMDSYKIDSSILKHINYSYSGDGIYFKQDILTGWEISSPYLFLGEIIKKNFNYNDWYGGTSDYALQQLNWNICSKTIEGFQNETDVTWGDTYYQRWECLKTYPSSELEVNSNVEVLSFMLESHTNLDGRSDTNRGTYNLINLRPSNTNIFNPVYNQSDNFFSYKILDEKFDKTVFENLVIWSLSKSNLDNIDKWTSISAVNSLSLDGKLGKITRIININDSLLAFQELGISAINYNLLAALSTYEGIPLLMGNTGKVTGYTKVTEDIGCSNKWALVLTGAGLFFIDNNTKSLYLYTANKGITNISKVGNFSMWFKDNIVEGEWNPSNNVGAFRLNYDKVTLDLYIHNDTSCLLYNTYLQTFTSFMSYKNTPLLLNHKGKSIAFWQAASTVMPYYMFEGSYNIIYGSPLNYYIEYRVNPSPYTDNLFTNYEYVADWTDPTTNSNDSNLFGAYRMDHFDIVKAWNEYLEGELSATTSLTGKHPIKTKFRIWRGDIPRNGDAACQRVLRGDRMRNPWIHLRFTKNSPGDSKMTFHNLNVIYYK